MALTRVGFEREVKLREVVLAFDARELGFCVLRFVDDLAFFSCVLLEHGAFELTHDSMRPARTPGVLVARRRELANICEVVVFDLRDIYAWQKRLCTFFRLVDAYVDRTHRGVSAFGIAAIFDRGVVSKPFTKRKPVFF